MNVNPLIMYRSLNIINCNSSKKKFKSLSYNYYLILLITPYLLLIKNFDKNPFINNYILYLSNDYQIICNGSSYG